jgi:cellulose synthase (UDP-forming)
MNPRLALQSWRERWDKADEGIAVKPYVGGKVYGWAKKIPHASTWARPGVTSLVLLLCTLFLLLVSHISFPINGQITFAGLMIAAGMYLRRFVGPLFTLLLICLSIMCTMQYLSWRLGQTIIDQSGAAFVWAFILGSTEVCIVFYFLLGWVRHLAPLSESETRISLEQADFPTIDVFLLCSGASTDAALEQISACSGLHWPANKFVLHISDAEKRSAIKEIATELNAPYVEELTPNIANGAADYILLIEQKNDTLLYLPQDFLKRTLGWFTQDESLAFLYDANHFLAPKVCAAVQKNEHAIPRGRAILRRAALLNGAELSLENFRINTWHKSALLSETSGSLTSATQPYLYKKINSAHSEKIIHRKQCLTALQQMLRFYGPVAIGVYLTSPLANLFFGIQLIQAPLQWWFAMAMPCVILIAMTEARCKNDYRLGTLREMRELLLAAYFLVPTSYSFLKTKLGRPTVAITKFGAEQSWPRFTHNTLTYLFFWANTIGLLMGIWSLQFANSSTIGWRIFYCGWALMNALILLSKKAIEHESSEVQWFAGQQGKVSGAIRLAFGRLLVCETINFPSLALTISTPIKLESVVGTQTQLTLYHLSKAYTLIGTVIKVDGLRATLQLNPSDHSDYQALRDAVFARGANWPAWLPHKDADRPLPEWGYRAMKSIPLKSLDFLTNLTTFLRWNTILKLWKK